MTVTDHAEASAADAVARDLHAGLALAGHQLSLPLRPGGLWPMLALVLLGVALAGPVRILALRLVARLVRRRDTSTRALVEAVATIVLTPLGVGLGAAAVLWGCDTGLFLLPVVRPIGETVAGGAAVTGFAIGIGRAVRALGRATSQPPAPLDRVNGLYGPGCGLMLAASGVAERTADLLGASAPSRLLVHGLVVAAEVSLIVAVLLAIGRGRDGAEAQEQAREQVHAGASQTVTALAWALLLVGAGGLVTGHLTFAVLLFQEMLWSALVVTFTVILSAATDRVVAWATEPRHRVHGFAVHVVGVRAERVTQIGLVAAALLKAALWLIALGLLLVPLRGGDLSLVDQLRVTSLARELDALPVAPGALLLSLAVLVGGILVTRLVRRWLERRFLPTTSLDIGARAAIVTGLGYACILVVLLVATVVAGIDIGRITLIASALSVGIGFGLQSIIQNFVAGVILLAERPIKVGDWVCVSGAEGSVRRIGVRSTELATAEGSMTLVPNSSFIAGAVTNRIGEGIAGRLQVGIRVAGLPSAAGTRDMVLALLTRTDAVLERPPPQVLLTDATADGFGFTLEVYADRRQPVAIVRSQILYAIVDGIPDGYTVTVT